MRGKLVENIKTQQIFEPTSVTATGTLFNGQSATSGYAVDTQLYDECVFILQAGVFSGSATVDAAIYESADDNTDNATAISGADFTQVTSANDQARQSLSVVCKDVKRYLWVRTSKTLNTNAALLSALAILGKPDSGPTDESPIADV